jgi:ribosomal protein S18 acetylase RimI-like enzyme
MTPSKFNIFTFNQNDEINERLLNEYTSLREQILNETSSINHQYTSDDYLENRKKTIEGENHYWIFLIILEDKLIGFSEFLWRKNEPNRLFFTLTGILPEFRRQGAVKELSLSMFETIKNEYSNVEYLFSFHNASNNKILNFVKMMGFTECSRFNNYSIILP